MLETDDYLHLLLDRKSSCRLAPWSIGRFTLLLLWDSILSSSNSSSLSWSCLVLRFLVGAWILLVPEMTLGVWERDWSVIGVPQVVARIWRAFFEASTVRGEGETWGALSDVCSGSNTMSTTSLPPWERVSCFALWSRVVCLSSWRTWICGFSFLGYCRTHSRPPRNDKNQST